MTAGIKLICPECGGLSYWYTDHNQFGYCFKCEYQERGTHKTQVKERGDIATYRALYTELSQWYHDTLPNECREYLHKRGLTDETINHYLLGYCSEKSHLLYKHPKAHEAGLVTQYGKPILVGRITFPYLLYDEVTDIRGRLFIGSGERYLSLLGSTYYRGANYAYNVNTSEHEILITEGEIKALAANQAGIYTVGLSGILSQRKVSLIDTDRQVLCFDSQTNGWHVQHAIDKQAERLSNPYVLTLPLYGLEKQDIDSYILTHGATSFTRLYRYARQYEHKQ